MYKFILFSLLIITTSLYANRKTEVLDAFDEIDPWDFNIELEYKYNSQSSKIKREYYCNQGVGSDKGNSQYKDTNCTYVKMKNNGIVNANNFKYTKVEQIIEPKLRFGLFKNVELYFALPIYISSVRKLGFDTEARKSASQTKSGEAIPESDLTHNGAGNTLWNLERTGGQDIFFAHKREKEYSFNTQKMTETDNTTDVDLRYSNAAEAFNGLSFERAGVKTLNMGLKWGILDNDRDSSDPSWVVGIEYRVPVVSSIEAYSEKKLDQIQNQTSPSDVYTSLQVRNMLSNQIDLSNKDMGDGVHWVKLETTISKRYNFASPVFSFWWEKPMIFGNSIFEKHKNREYYKPGSRFGFTLATDLVPWERYRRDKVTEAKTVLADFTVSFGANFFHQMKGMNLSEISDFIALPTVVDSYSNASLFFNLSYMPTKYIRLTTGVDVGYTTDHLITNQAKGIDHDNNGILEPDEYDPMYKDGDANDVNDNYYATTLFNSINSAGSRIQLTETLMVSAFFKLHVQF